MTEFILFLGYIIYQITRNIQNKVICITLPEITIFKVGYFHRLQQYLSVKGLKITSIQGYLFLLNRGQSLNAFL